MTTLAKVAVPLGALLCLVPMVPSWLALLAGIAVAVVLGNPHLAGTKKATAKLLPYSVVGLGAGMNLSVVARVGASGIGYTVAGIALTLGIGWILGRILHTPRDTSTLVSVGTAICGGSAIAAVGPAIEAKSQDMSVALGTVFLLNATALVLFPPIGHRLGLSEPQFGLWAALAIHDTSSVVGAAMQYGPEGRAVGEAAVVHPGISDRGGGRDLDPGLARCGEAGRGGGAARPRGDLVPDRREPHQRGAEKRGGPAVPAGAAIVAARGLGDAGRRGFRPDRLSFSAACAIARVPSQTLQTSGSLVLQALLDSDLHNPTYQVKGNRLSQRKLHRTLFAAITRQLILELLSLSWHGIEPDMIFVGAKMNQIAVQSEGRHLIFDGLLRAWGRFSDRRPDLFQNLLDVRGEARNVLVDVFGCRLIGFHPASFEARGPLPVHFTPCFTATFL